MDVQTREGIYGGGVFDGSNMGFGAIGALSPSSVYTWKAGDTGSSVAKYFTGNANNWTQLAAANPAHKCTKYGFCAKVNDVVTLPSSWVAQAPAALPASSDTPGTISATSPGESSPTQTVTAPAASSSLVPAESGMSNTTIIAGAVGVALVIGILVMRRK